MSSERSVEFTKDNIDTYLKEVVQEKSWFSGHGKDCLKTACKV